MVAARRRERIIPRMIEDEMRDSFLDYSMSVIVQRAIPDVRDGLKPVHRRILYAMHELGLRPEREHKKCATVVGDVLGKYHPHGDSAVYDALVRMVQDFSLRYPLINGQGNFGSIDGDSAAAYRYTEAKLAAVATDLLDDIEKDTVDWLPNFDGRLEEPQVLPGVLPNFLVNGSSGIAVGMSTNVPPHNLREIAEGIRLLAGESEVSTEDLLEVIPGPDFPTGGFVLGDEGVRQLYSTGRGRMRVRARVLKEKLRGGKSQLVVTELPYTVSKARVIQQIADLARKGALDGVADLRDESDRDGMRIVIELKRSAKTDGLLRVLYKKTHLETTFGGIMLALDEGQPREFTLLEALERYRDHRLDVIRRRSTHDLEKAEAERHIVEGLLAALDQIDEVIRIIRASKDREEASERLQELLGLSEIQASAILNMRLARLTALERDQLEARLKELSARIKDLRAILASEARQLEVMLAELDELVERYGDERRTVILEGDREDIEETAEAAVAEEDVVITVSHQGFAKRIPMHLYRRRVKAGKALAGMERYDEDYLEQMFVARTTGWLLGFTAGGQAYFLPVLDVPEGGRASRGSSLYSLVEADRSDPLVALVPVDDLEADGHLLFLSREGLVKRTELSEFSNPRAGGIIAAGVKSGDRILDVALSTGEAQILLISREGRAIRFPESQISVVGRTARGVKGIGLKGDDAVVGMVRVRRGASVFMVMEDGLAKRTAVDDFPLQKRGGMGTLAAPTDQKAPLVGALEVLEADQVSVVSAGGQLTRIAAADVPIQGRRTRGTRVVKVPRGDRLVELTRSLGQSGQAEAPLVREEADEQVPDGGAPPEGQLDLLGA